MSSSFNIIKNNSLNKYGTASFVINEFCIENLNCDTDGRVISFNIDNITFSNFYMPSGNDQTMRNKRENYFAEIIPQLLINSKTNGCAGGDFNCIINKRDATKNQENKMSPSLKKLVKTFSWEDSYRILYPNSQSFSRYYDNVTHGDGATRIDRNYQYGDIEVI